MAQDDPHPRSISKATRRVPEGGAYQPDKLAFEIPDDIQGEETDGGKLAKRLSIAFVLIAAVAVFNIVLMRRWDMGLHPLVLFGAFGVILVASVLSAWDEQPGSQTLATKSTENTREEQR